MRYLQGGGEQLKTHWGSFPLACVQPRTFPVWRKKQQHSLFHCISTVFKPDTSSITTGPIATQLPWTIYTNISCHGHFSLLFSSAFLASCARAAAAAASMLRASAKARVGPPEFDFNCATTSNIEEEFLRGAGSAPGAGIECRLTVQFREHPPPLVIPAPQNGQRLPGSLICRLMIWSSTDCGAAMPGRERETRRCNLNGFVPAAAPAPWAPLERSVPPCGGSACNPCKCVAAAAFATALAAPLRRLEASIPALRFFRGGSAASRCFCLSRIAFCFSSSSISGMDRFRARACAAFASCSCGTANPSADFSRVSNPKETA